MVDKNFFLINHQFLHNKKSSFGLNFGVRSLYQGDNALGGGTKIGESSKIGNFVEIKKSNISNKVKINHLSYIGDTEIGSYTNIGAGTITCNYDGKRKLKTKIKNNVFVGSNSSLIAPVTLEDKSIVGAGSVITKKVNKKSLALTRANQIEIKDYKKIKK